MKNNSPSTYTGVLLVSLPSFAERAFRRAVVLVCAHSERGAMGVMINRPATNISLRRLLQENGLQPPRVSANVPISAGGPADIDRVLVIHSNDYRVEGTTLDVAEGISVTSHMTVLEDLANKRGPAKALVTLGFCAWGEGELDREIASGTWLTGPATEELVLGTPTEDRWRRTMDSMGIAPSNLSGFSGRA